MLVFGAAFFCWEGGRDSKRREAGRGEKDGGTRGRPVVTDRVWGMPIRSAARVSA